MAETLTSGSSYNVTLDYDDSITVTGTATVIATGPVTSVNTANIGTTTYGPYARGASVRIIAGGSVTYTLNRVDGGDGVVRYSMEQNPSLSGAAAGAVRGAVIQRSNTLAMRTIGAQQQNTSDNNRHRQWWRIKGIGGKWVRVRAVQRNASATGFTIAGIALTAGRDWTEQNPTDATGTAAVWQQMATDLVIPESPVPGLGFATTVTPWFTVYVPPEITDPSVGVLVTSSFIATGGRASSGSTVNSSTVGAGAVNSQRQATLAGGDGTLASLSASFLSAAAASFFVFDLEIQVVGAQSVWISGDSRSTGSRDNSVDSRDDLYGWAAMAVDSLNVNNGKTVSLCNFGFHGTSSDVFHGRLLTALNDSGITLPDVVLVQVMSSNDTSPWTDATVNAAFGRSMDIAEAARKRGVTPCLYTSYPGPSLDSAPKVAAWARVNEQIRQSGLPYIDFDVPALNDGATLPRVPTSLSGDGGQHLNTAGQLIARDLALPVLRGLL